MDKVIPILPCPDIKVQIAFFQQLGFEVKGVYTSPNPYAVLQFGTIELHFYGSKRMAPAHNSSMCFIKVEDVDAIYETFADGLKKHTGKVPRSGIPKITKVRDLSLDRRFTLTDTGGNTFYIGTPVESGAENFFRTLQNEEHAQKFTVLYDLLHSKEDPPTAANMLPKLMAVKEEFNELDQAKLLLIEFEIQRQLGQPTDEAELQSLLDARANGGEDWGKVRDRYEAILQE